MKTLNKICQVLCVVFGLVAFVLFFMNFATFTVGDKSETLVGTVLAFGGKSKGVIGNAVKMAVSSKLLFCFILTAIGFVMSIFSFKSKGLRYAVPAFSLGAAIFMLVVSLSSPYKFVDASAFRRNEIMITGLKYTPVVLLTSIALFAFAAFAIAYLLIDDYIEASESKSKKTIIQRIGLFFRDYKSEVKKIVWPNLNDVVKNTIIVLAMCLLVGAFIWLLDWGLGSLIKVILNVKK